MTTDTQAEKPKSKPKSKPVVLPTGIVRSKIFNPRVLLVYAAPKKGKSTIMTGFENYIILDTEGSTDYLDAVKINVRGAGGFLKTCDAIIAAGRPYKYVIVDTVSGLENFIQPLAIKMYKRSPAGKNFTSDDILGLPHGGGYYWYRKAFFHMLNKAEACRPKDGSLVLVAHLRDKIIRKGDEEVQAKDIDLTGKMREILCRDCDAIGYFYRDGDDGRLNFQTSDMDNCGTRCRHLDGKDILISKKVGERVDIFWKEVYINVQQQNRSTNRASHKQNP